jgi:hypothetical protein
LEPLTMAHSQFVPSLVEIEATFIEETGIIALTLTATGPAIAPGPEIVNAAGFGEKKSAWALAAPGKAAKKRQASVTVLIKRSIFTSATPSREAYNPYRTLTVTLA